MNPKDLAKTRTQVHGPTGVQDSKKSREGHRRLKPARNKAEMAQTAEEGLEIGDSLDVASSETDWGLMERGMHRVFRAFVLGLAGGYVEGE